MTDRRVQRTRMLLFEALNKLMKKKKYSAITIQDIIDEANVGRSTFYSHYPTKDDLLFDNTERYLEMLNHYIFTVFETADEKDTFIPLEEMFIHIKENEKVIRSLFMSGEGTDTFILRAERYWYQTIANFLKRRYPGGFVNEVPIDIMAHHIAHSILRMVELWLTELDQYTVAEINEYCQKLIRPLLVRKGE